MVSKLIDKTYLMYLDFVSCIIYKYFNDGIVVENPFQKVKSSFLNIMNGLRNKVLGRIDIYWNKMFEIEKKAEI